MRQKIFYIIIFSCFVFSLVSFLKDVKVLSQVEYSASNSRDPFQRQLPKKPKVVAPVVKEPVVPPDITVQALVAGGPFPQVMIDGRIWRVGDTVKDAIISQINKDGIEVLYKGEIFSLPGPSAKFRAVVKGENDAKQK